VDGRDLRNLRSTCCQIRRHYQRLDARALGPSRQLEVVPRTFQQKVSDLITVVVLFAVAAAYYFIFVAPRQGRYWVQANLPDPYHTAQPLPAQD